jgi:rare lipoprotein A (peptidoglycan hydrolase)
MKIPFNPARCKLRAPSIRNVQRRFHVAHLCLTGLLAFLMTNWAPLHAMGPTRQHPGDTQSGMASWYGADQGRHTASGERFNPRDLTAAHRHLPFGTIIRVTNNLNGRTVDVRINDRGPWAHGRILDLSSAAADALDMKRYGVIPVTIEILKLGLGRHHTHE